MNPRRRNRLRFGSRHVGAEAAKPENPHAGSLGIVVQICQMSALFRPCECDVTHVLTFVPDKRAADRLLRLRLLPKPITAALNRALGGGGCRCLLDFT